MSGLVEKLEATEVGSRELDALMHVEVANDPNTCVANSVFSFRDGWYCTGADMVCLADPVTTSLDAALALAERVLPGRWVRSLTEWPTRTMQEAHEGKPHWGKDKWRALLVEYEAPCRDATSVASTPALALCAAILRARSAGEG